MARILNITLEATDEEIGNLLARIQVRGVTDLNASTASYATEADDGTDDDAGPVNGAAPQVDKNGVPWLESVHASTKGTTADGSWRRRKGVTAEQVDQAVAAWRASVGGGQSAPAATAPIPPVPPVPGMPTGAPAATGMPGMPVFTPPAPEPVSYQQIAEKYQALSTGGKITPEQVMEVYKQCGVTDVNELTTNESLRRKLMDELNKFG